MIVTMAPPRAIHLAGKGGFDLMFVWKQENMGHRPGNASPD